MKIFGYEPAIILYAVNGAVATAVAWGWDLTADQTGAITTITTAILTIAAAAMTRPVTVSVITAAAGSILAAFAAFRLELSADQISTAVTAGSVALMLLLRLNVSPAPAIDPRLPRART